MRQMAIIASLCLALSVVGIGCDGAGVSDEEVQFVRPTVTVHYVNARYDVAPKGQAVVRVELTVTSASGQDFSPDPIEVDDAVDSEARFELFLPPDSEFIFQVLLTQNTELVAEGSVIQFITEASSRIDIPVISTVGERWFVILPSDVDTRTSTDSLDLTMRYYGDEQQIVGLAARLAVNGPDPAPVRFVDVDRIVENDTETSLGWQFGSPVMGTQDLGTIRVPLAEASDFCLDVEEGDFKVVNRDGVIAVIGASGACVNVE